ncbi:winged helix-turn-helix transcriptional regulator [Amycolatopsis ruanii]|uniref:winged helix-turn-helix transcriptional regulator n=1 Tax=Amycolatopsis ruanii TaxID=944491 RepID=UPI000E249E53|nr:response regulator transcription factor [Amycolatopsis ruanii]
MSGMLTQGWESDNSQFHARRRACLSAGGRRAGRLAVLLVERDTDLVRRLLDALAGQPVEVKACADPAEALLQVGRTCPDVVVVGPGGGRLDAAEFLTILRADDPDLPVVAAAGPGSGDFAVRATELGATAVVPRPYRPRELLRLLRSFAPRPDQVDLRPLPIDLGRLRVDGAVPQFWLDGRTVPLPPMEFLLLRYFAERVGAVLTRKELLQAVWGDRGAATHSNTLSVHVLRLRKRLGDDEADPQWIKVVRGLGYRFTVPGSEPRSPDVHPR